jgi:hypothetical protein
MPVGDKLKVDGKENIEKYKADWWQKHILTLGVKNTAVDLRTFFSIKAFSKAAFTASYSES